MVDFIYQRHSLMKINIAIDGPSASGKSTIAKELAKQLGYIHIDTGAMYRSVAYYALKTHVSLEDENQLVHMIEKMDIELTLDGLVLVNQNDVSTLIRQNEVSLAASKISTYPKVRSQLVAQQQKMTKSKGFIVDGRDIGTVVLPEAELKIYQTASVSSRAQRRYLENIQKGIHSDFEELKKEIEERDYQDTHREASPLKKAKDAIEIDTSLMSIDEVVDMIKKYYFEKVLV